MRVGIAAIVALLVAVAPAGAQGLDQSCVEALTKVDAATVNVAYPDEGALYYGANYAAAPGTEIVIHGRYPHARYISFNVYDSALRPIESLSDLQLFPDPGAVNPFVAGADRNGEQRGYTARIVFAKAPDKRPPNTMYVDPAASPGGLILYRIYLPDRDRDATGDVGLPTVTVVPAGGDAEASSPCTNVEKPSVTGINELLAQSGTPADPPARGPDPPLWRKFVNFASAVAVTVTGSPAIGGVDLDQAGGSGGFLSNRDNAYVAAQLERGHGQVSVTRVKAPVAPDTRDGAAVMPAGQVRYWSMCENDPNTQRYVACTPDDRAVLDREGFATFVVSTPANRPANATARCGVNWLPWGPNSRGLLILRHMLPDGAFAESVQRAQADKETATMGDYFPRSRYLADAAAFEKTGCAPPARTPASGGGKPAKRPCRSRRRIVVHLPSAARHGRYARVRIGTVRTRRVRVRRDRGVVVDLRGLPKGRYAVRIRSGATRVVRHFRTCA